MKNIEDLRFRGSAMLSAYDVIDNRSKAIRTIGKRLSDHISYNLAEAKIEEKRYFDKIEFTLDLIVMTPSEFWEIVNVEASKICGERNRYEINNFTPHSSNT